MELFNYYKPSIDFNCGYVYVAFMREDPDNAPPRFEDRLGEFYRDDHVARGVFGCFGKMLQRDVQIFCANFVYIHCELAFASSEAGKRAHGADRLLAVLVNSYQNVSMRWRHFDARYEWIQLRATPRQIEMMLKFACTTRGEQFSEAQRNAVILRPGVEQPTGWYCTKHVASMLRVLDCEMFHVTRVNTVTVDELHVMVYYCDHTSKEWQRVRTPIELERIYGRENAQEVLYRPYGGQVESV